MRGEFGLENMGTRGGRLLVCLVSFFPAVWSLCNSDLSSQSWLYLYRRFWRVQGLGGFRSGRVSLMPFEHNPNNWVRHTDLPCQAIHPSVWQLVALNWMMICTSVGSDVDIKGAPFFL